MKITILQENLAKGLSTVNKFVSSKTQLPVLANILFSAGKGKLKLSATNLETGINYWLPAKIEGRGEITIPAKIITEFVSSLPTDKAHLTAVKNKLEVSCRNFKASFNSISANEFPAIPSLKAKKTTKTLKKFSLKTNAFVKAVSQVAFTAAIDESRPVLTGIRWSFLGKKIQLVATDGYRLSLKTLKLTEKMDLKTLIIPARTLTELARICSQEKKETITITLSKKTNQAIFSFDEIEVVTRLIEGEFPDFEKIIPQEKTTKIIIDKEELYQAVRAAALFAKDSANIVRFEVKGKKLKVSANAPEIGENEVELEIKKEGEDNKIAFNHRFLQEYLNISDKKELVLEMSGSLKPGVFKPLGQASFLHIIMPVRLQE